MSKPLTELLSPENGLIFRITHVANVPWILENGLHCHNSSVLDPDFVSIGNPELIEARSRRAVPIVPGGTLDDYIPFYFTPFSPMMYNIHTGYRGIQRRQNSDIVILVSSIHEVDSAGCPFVYTDRHACLHTAEFFSAVAQLSEAVDYALLRSRDFRRDPEHPEKTERYQAEALVYKRLPVSLLMGVGCYSDDVKAGIDALASSAGLSVKVKVRKDWYF